MIWRCGRLRTPIVDDGRQLKAKTLAKGGGGLKEDIVAFERCCDDFSL